MFFFLSGLSDLKTALFSKEVLRTVYSLPEQDEMFHVQSDLLKIKTIYVKPVNNNCMPAADDTGDDAVAEGKTKTQAVGRIAISVNNSNNENDNDRWRGVGNVVKKQKKLKSFEKILRGLFCCCFKASAKKNQRL